MIVKRAALSQCRYYRESPVQSSQVTVVLLCSTFITNSFCGGTLYQSVRGMKLSYWSLHLPITPLEGEICLFNASKTVSPFLLFYFLMSEILTGSVSSSSRQLFLMINLLRGGGLCRPPQMCRGLARGDNLIIICKHSAG